MPAGSRCGADPTRTGLRYGTSRHGAKLRGCSLRDDLVLVDGDHRPAECWDILLAPACHRLGGRAEVLLAVIDAKDDHSACVAVAKKVVGLQAREPTCPRCGLAGDELPDLVEPFGRTFQHRQPR